MSRIVFLRMDGEDQVELKMSGDLTWMDVTDRFVQFLQGCGYFVTADEVAGYLQGCETTPNEGCCGATACCAEKNGVYPTINISTSELEPTQSFTIWPADDSFVTISPTAYDFNSLNTATSTWYSRKD